MKKYFILMLLIAALIIAAIFLYLKFYGRNIFEARLSEVLGRPIRFKSFALDLNKYTVLFEDFSFPNRAGFTGKNLFDAAKVVVALDKDKFNKDREILFKHIFIEKATLRVERNRVGVFNIAGVQTRNVKRSIAGLDSCNAYADVPEPKPSPFYKFASNVKKLEIKDSAIEFKDYQIYGMPYTITCENFNLDINSDRGEGSSSDSIPVKCTTSFAVPSDRYTKNGHVSAFANIDIYRYMMDVNMVVETQVMDIMHFYPYLEKHTPFSVREGLFSSETNLRMQANMIDSLTTMVFYRLSLAIDPGKQNAEFLRTSVNKLAPYLTSQSGNIIFDFYIKGTLDNLKARLGPRVNEAIGMVAMEEAARVIQGLQGLK